MPFVIGVQKCVEFDEITIKTKASCGIIAEEIKYIAGEIEKSGIPVKEIHLVIES